MIGRRGPGATTVLRAGVLLALALAGCGGTLSAPAGSPEADGHVEVGSFASTAIRARERYAVYLPAGYDAGDRRYPVIYALHGLPSDADGYRRIDIGAWGRAAERLGRPAIMVSPQGARPGDPDPEWHDFGPGRDWETLVADELVAHVDGAYRTIADRRARGIVGISAGGYGASIIGVRHPATYAVVQSWSGYFHPTNPEGDAPLPLGSPEADSAASVHSYVDEARRDHARGLTLAFGFFVGDEDPHFLPENEQLHRELLAAMLPHDYAVYPGAHTEAFWREHEDGWIADALRHLQRAG